MKNKFSILIILFFPIMLFCQVGIKTNAPTHTLDVNGTSRIRNFSSGIVSVDANGVFSTTSTNIGYAEGSVNWNGLLIGTQSSIFTLTAKETITNTAISCVIHYDIDDQVFYPMLLSGCSFSNLGASAGNNGRFRLTVGATNYDFSFVNAGITSNVSCSLATLSGTFMSIVY